MRVHRGNVRSARLLCSIHSDDGEERKWDEEGRYESGLCCARIGINGSLGGACPA